MAPLKDYRTSREYTLVIFDLRVPGSVERLQRERAAWQGYADIEVSDLDHAVLVVQPGGAQRPSSW